MNYLALEASFKRKFKEIRSKKGYAFHCISGFKFIVDEGLFDTFNTAVDVYGPRGVLIGRTGYPGKDIPHPGLQGHSLLEG